MSRLKLLVFLFACLIIQSCNSTTGNENASDTDEQSSYSDDDSEIDEYPDGTYCADVDYYNSNTGTRSSYSLNVDVEDHEVVLIHFPNGGWLDDTHFSPEALDDDGSCSFSSRNGNQYDIQITGSECSYTDAARMRSDLQQEKDEVTCPKCGGEKYSYNDYCDSCKDKAEKTCTRCGEHDSFMWAGDELCSDCKRDDEEAEEKRKRDEQEQQEEQERREQEEIENQ